MNETTTATTADFLTLITDTVGAFGDSNWTLGSGLLIMVLVVLTRRLGLLKKLPKTWMPWAASGLAVLGSIASGLQAGRGWLDIVVTGLTTGLVAVGGWETLGKLITKKSANE